MSREQFLRLLDAAEYLATHIHEAPVWIVPCLEGGTPTRTSDSSIYPSVQNMLLAARALGLGATLTTLYLQFEKEAEAALGLPPGVHSYALLPIGYPMGRFGPVRRVPLADVVYENRWGQPFRARVNSARIHSNDLAPPPNSNGGRAFQHVLYCLVAVVLAALVYPVGVHHGIGDHDVQCSRAEHAQTSGCRPACVQS
jgi:hypothetical protein